MNNLERFRIAYVRLREYSHLLRDNAFAIECKARKQDGLRSKEERQRQARFISKLLVKFANRCANKSRYLELKYNLFS